MERTLLTCLAFALAVAVLAAPAAADPGGGAQMPGPPKITAVVCLSAPDAPCRPARALLRGRAFAVQGSGLERVSAILFRGRRGRRDDVRTRPAELAEGRVVASVPVRARSGRVTLVDPYGRRVSTKTAVRVADAAAPAPVDLAPGSRFFFDSRRKPSFSFDVPRAMDVQVELANTDTGELVRSWTVSAQPGAPNVVRWDGLGPRGVEPLGAYSFRITGQATGAAATPGTEAAFAYADHLFPIRGRHNLGYTDTNNFGGGRGHKGQDMFARCGTRLAAARGGRVEYAGYHSAAGYYVVVDGAETDVDYVYMHMLEPALVETGQRVFTGQKLGEVGETGRATGCHLHFELWSAPGWYKGGEAFDPLPSLRRWDSYS